MPKKKPRRMKAYRRLRRLRLSLSRIAARFGVTKQAVHDALRRASA